MTSRAPIAVPVEVRAGARRVFRLSSDIGEDGLTLEQPAPFEGGRPVELRFSLPGSADQMTLRAELQADQPTLDENGRPQPAEGGSELFFYEITASDVEELREYVKGRLTRPV